MATADEILAESSGILTIDLNSRQIIIPPTITNLGVESDDDVLRLKFEVPRQYGEFDLSTFENRINILNANGEPDVYEVDDVKVAEDEKYFTFSWLVGRFAVQYKGDVKFVVCMKKYTDETKTVVEKEFNSTVATLPSLEGLETDAAIVAEYPDILNNWMEEILSDVNEGIERYEALETECEERIAKMDMILSNVVFVNEVAI